jgi:hypothetical protein
LLSGPALRAGLAQQRSWKQDRHIGTAQSPRSGRSGAQERRSRSTATGRCGRRSKMCECRSRSWSRAGQRGRAAVAEFFPDPSFDSPASIAGERRATPLPDPPPQGGRESPPFSRRRISA